MRSSVPIPGAPIRLAARTARETRSAVPGWEASMSGSAAVPPPCLSWMVRFSAVRKREAAKGS